MRKASIMFVIIIIALAVASGLVVAACGSDSTSDSSASASAAPTGPIKVGHIVNLTGPEAMVGEGQAKVLEAAFEDIGAISGRTVEVITEDAKGEPSAAVDAARKLVESDGVVAIFGPTEIGQKLAVASYLKTAGVPQITYNPTPLMAFEGNDMLIGTGGTTPQGPSTMGDYIYQDLGWKAINTLTEDNTAGRAFMDPLTEVFTKEGGKVVKQAWVPEETGDFSPILTTLPAADGMAAWEPGGAGIKFWIQWQATGTYKKLPVAAAYHGGFTDPFIPKALPPAAATAMVGTPASQGYSPDADTPENKEMQTVLTPVLGFPPADDGASGPWQAALVFQAGVEANNGDTTADTLVPAILGTTTVGPEGTTTFVDGSHAATRTYYIVEVFQVPGKKGVFTYKTVKTYDAVPPEGFTPQ